jgi:O-antigen ligase
MAYLQNTSVEKFPLIISYLAKTSFLIYLFFTFFTPSLPFQEKPAYVEDVATSSLFNQLLYSCLYVFSSISLFSKKNLIIKFIKTEKFLTLFILWSFLTVFWSDYPFISFKRWLQILGSAIIFLAVLLHLRSADEAMQYFKAILFIYLPLSLLSIIFIPGAIQWEFPAWRGIAPHKNTLGQVSLIGLIVWTSALWHERSKNKLSVFIFWGLSLVLLAGSQSTTSILAAIALLLFVGLSYIEKQIVRPVVGFVFSSIFFLLFFLGSILFVYLLPDYLASLFRLFGKDLTLTGRIDIWSLLLEEIQKHLLHGYGFGGYWVSNNHLIDVFLEEYFWVPNQAHNGYLDILNETGGIGILILILMVIFYFTNLNNSEKPNFFKWFVIATLILNITESTLFVPNMLTGVLFTFSYIALYTEIIIKDFTRS